MCPFKPCKFDSHSEFCLPTTQETTPNPEKRAPAMAKDAHSDENDAGQLPEASGEEQMDLGATEQKNWTFETF